MPQLARLALALLVAAALPAAADEAPGRIVVVGSAEVAAVPDVATITAGVETRGPTAAEAMAANSEAMTAVFAALDAAGIERRDLQTRQLDLSSVQSQPRDAGDEAPRIVAYEAANMVTVRVRDIDGLGGVVDALTQAGANRFYGIAFEVSDPREDLDAAREQAVADARARAELYARAAGVTLGPVLSISDEPQGGMPMMRADAAMAAAPPVAAGTVSLSASVRIVYAIE